MIRTSMAVNAASNAAMNLASRSRISRALGKHTELPIQAPSLGTTPLRIEAANSIFASS